MIDVRIAAKYLIHLYEEESGRTMDEMKLHKLLYFTQRESFILLGKPMFPERVTRLKEDSYYHLSPILCIELKCVRNNLQPRL